MTADLRALLRRLEGVKVESAGGNPLRVEGTVDGMPFSLDFRRAEWRLAIDEQEPWFYGFGADPTTDDAAAILNYYFEQWRAERAPESDAARTRKRLSVYLDEQRARLRRIDTATFAALAAHLRGLVSDPSFDPIEFLSRWLLGPVPTLGGITPAEVLGQPGGLERVKDVLSRWSYGTGA